MQSLDGVMVSFRSIDRLTVAAILMLNDGSISIGNDLIIVVILIFIANIYVGIIPTMFETNISVLLVNILLRSCKYVLMIGIVFIL